VTVGADTIARAPTADEPEPPFEAAVVLPRALQAVGSIAAPTGLLTGLFFYFGLLYAVAYYRHFGVNYSVLELPFTGVLILSASTAVVPLAVLAAASWIVLRVYRIPVDPSPAVRPWLVRGLLPAVALTGTLLVVLTVADLLGAGVFATLWEGRGLSLSLGIVLLGYAERLRRALLPARPAGGARRGGPLVLTVANWVCLCTLFGIGLFWAVGSYALRVGEQDAQRFTAGLACGPDVIVYSEQDLHLAAAGVREERLPGADQGYAFRYSGLKLVPQPGEMYLLLPADWAPGVRPSILLPRSNSVRLEFVTVTGGRPAGC
jgi:hypothetical protein